MVFTSYSLRYRLIIAGLVALNQCRRCQNPQEIFGIFCLLHRKGAPPSHKLAISDVAKFLRHERVEKCWNKNITNMQSYIKCS